MSTPTPTTRLSPLVKGAPIAASGQAFAQIMPSPHALIWDTTASSDYGAVMTSWQELLAVASEMPGRVEIFVANGSVIPAGNWTVQAIDWILTSDQNGITFANGCYFQNSPSKIAPGGNSALTFLQSAAGQSTFTLTGPLTVIDTCTLVLGSAGYVFNGTSGGSLVMRSAQVTSTSGQLLLNGGAGNRVTLFEASVLLNNLMPSTVSVYYDPTSTPASQNGNTGTPLFTALQGPAGATGAAGPTGPAGPAGSGGPSYLPATEPADGNFYYLYVNSSGQAIWSPTTAYSGGVTSSQATAVEIGTSIASVTYGNNFNFSPTNVSVTLTNPQGGTQTLTTPTGTFTGPFENTSNTPYQTLTIAMTATDPDGISHNSSFTVTWCTRVVWGSVTPPVTVNSALYTSLLGQNSQLDGGSGSASATFNSSFGQNQVFAMNSTIHDANFVVSGGGENYTAQFLGTAAGTGAEAGITYAFFQVGAPGQQGFNVQT